MTDKLTTTPQPLAPPETLHHHLLEWYRHAQRDLPWRRTSDPYAIWLSEMMLQQTQVETVKPYYARFLARFPTINSLAEADLQEVLSLWAGLGYYRRAKHLHQAAQAVVQHHAGRLPETVDALRTLPGIGRYTAGAIASIAFHQPAPIVDGNVMRVLARLAAYDQDIADPRHHAFFWTLAQQIVSAAPKSHYGDVNQALMELGATVCTPPPSRPACLLCPLRNACRAYGQGRQLDLPVKSKKPSTPIIRALALILLRPDPADSNSQQVLLLRRPTAAIWEDMWEFPTLTHPRSPKALPTHLATALGLPLSALTPLAQVRHTLTHRQIRLHLHRAVTASPSAPLLPPCATANAHPYTDARWLPWPLPPAPPVPVSRLVHKIIAAAQPPAPPASPNKPAKPHLKSSSP